MRCGRGVVGTVFQVGGSKGAIFGGGGGGELNRIFLQIEFRFRNGLGRALSSQNFRITHLINAEILAKVCTTRNENKLEKKSILM